MEKGPRPSRVSKHLASYVTQASTEENKVRKIEHHMVNKGHWGLRCWTSLFMQFMYISFS